MWEVFDSSASKQICFAEEADTAFGRLKGLMLRKKLKRDEGLLIKFPQARGQKFCSVHSFFMRFAIDLVFISEDMRVVDLKTLKLWRIYSPKESCRWVLEVSEGKIAEKNIKIGDLMEFRRFVNR